jgi:hypothetical protein
MHMVEPDHLASLDGDWAQAIRESATRAARKNPTVNLRMRRPILLTRSQILHYRTIGSMAPRRNPHLDTAIWVSILYNPYGNTKMKTTIEISDPLLRDARKLAMREGVTLRTLVERGLSRVVSETRKSGAPFKLRAAAFQGKGLQAEFRGASWEKISQAAYEGRGD